MNAEDFMGGFGIYMLPAFEGDCIYVQIPICKSKYFRIMIDCGPVRCWTKSLKPFLDMISSAGETIDLLILTHIDSDHIGGAIPLFKDPHYACLFHEVWFNGLYQILSPEERSKSFDDQLDKIYYKVAANHVFKLSEPEEKISANQAISVGNELIEHEVNWNIYTNGDAICQTTPTYEIAPNIYIDFLLPKHLELKKLLSTFRKEVNSIRMGTNIIDTAEARLAFEQTILCSQESAVKSVPICAMSKHELDIQQLADKCFSEDTSITNGSSIAICLRYHNQALLFPGDAHGNDLIEALTQWSCDSKLPLNFAAVKLPHHGSAYNCMNLLDYIRSAVFLVSTDGVKFPHPDAETIAKIISKYSKLPRNSKVYFNYESKIYRLFTEFCKEPHVCERLQVTHDFIPLIDEG